ncbi:MAG: M23 family metallopeptidase [Vulcanimicrobiaceae bacterium]
MTVGTIAALLILALVGRRAFYPRTYFRLVLIAVVVIIAAENTLPLLAIPGLDASLSGALVAAAVLVYAVAKTYARLPERKRWLAETASGPLVLAVPFEGRWRVVAGGPDPGSNHHLVASDQRYAYDFARSERPSLGSRILAPVAGRIVISCDGKCDHAAALRVIEDESPLGNHVAIDTGGGVVFLCHLQSGSILVQPGEMVVVGREIGRCGNSGRTTRSHLHIHAQDLGTFAFNCAHGIPIAFINANGAVVLRAGALLSVTPIAP